MPTYAKGKNAVGICGRSGRKMPLSQMVQDGQIPGMMVDPAWRDMKNPQEKSIPLGDAVTLRKPAPDVDDDTPGATGVTLATALGGANYFGGGT